MEVEYKALLVQLREQFPVKLAGTGNNIQPKFTGINLFASLPLGYESVYLDAVRDLSSGFFTPLAPLRAFLYPSGDRIGLESQVTARWRDTGRSVCSRLSKVLPSSAMNEVECLLFRPNIRFPLWRYCDSEHTEEAVRNINAAMPEGILCPAIRTIKLSYIEMPLTKAEWWFRENGENGHNIYKHPSEFK